MSDSKGNKERNDRHTFYPKTPYSQVSAVSSVVLIGLHTLSVKHTKLVCD